MFDSFLPLGKTIKEPAPGFARVRGTECGQEDLLAFPCKRRHFCPSCRQKRVVEFGEWICGEVLKKVSPEVKVRPSPEGNVPSITIPIDDSDSQIPFSDSFCADPDYPMDSYRS